MNTAHFPAFARINYPNAFSQEHIEDSDLIELGNMFKKYLEEKFKDKMDKLDKIWDINPVNAMLKSDHPLFTNGYNPALIIHFGNFLEEYMQQASH